MASRQEWLVVIPDFENSLEKRLAVREEHLKNVTPHVQSGRVLMGGSTLVKPLKDGEAPQMNGSAMVVEADTKEEVIGLLKGDVYAKNGAWDVDSAQIWPVKIAVQRPPKQA